MNRSRVLLLFLVVLRATSVLAGGEWEESPEEKQAKVIDRQWAKEGAAAIPAMVKSLCGENFWLADAAQNRLQRFGAGAAGPLLGAQQCERELSPSNLLATLACDDKAGASTQRLLLQALKSKDRRRLAALMALGAMDCFGRDREAVKPFVAPVTQVLKEGDQDARFEAVKVVARIGPAAPELAGLLVPLIAEGGAIGEEAIDAAGSVGVADPALITALRNRLHGTDGERRKAFRALRGLARGTDRELVLGDALALIAQNPGDPCTTSGSPSVDAAIEAVGHLSDAGPDRALQGLLGTERRLSRCNQFPLNAFIEAARYTRQSDSAVLLTAMLRDDALPVFLRERVASELRERKLLNPEDEALANAIGVQSSAWTQPEAQVVIQVSDEQRILQHVNGCRAAGGKTQLQSVKVSADENAQQQFTGCLQQRLCGPDEKRYREAMSGCCEKAFGKTPPEWCHP